MSDTESLFEKLKSMNVHLGAGHLKTEPRPRSRANEIDTVVHGSEYLTDYGATFISQEHYSSDYRHGRVPLCADCATDVLSAWCGVHRINQPGGANVVFLDTETSGLAGGTGTYAFLVGIGYRTETGFDLLQFFMRDPSQEAALLSALNEWLARFDVVVTFNGKSFDLPLLNTRYTMNSIASPFDPYEHVDLLHVARRVWRDRLPSRALGELEKVIVHFERESEDIPGWMIPQIYFDYLRSRDARPLSGVFYHNAVDILSLAALYGYMADLLNDPIRQGDGYGLDLAAVARLYEEMGRLEEAATLYGRSLEMGDLPEQFYLKAIERFSLLRRKQGDWDHAVELWRQAAGYGEVWACIELSKFYEHRQRNNMEALYWAKAALENLGGSRFFEYTNKTMEREIQRRIGRLYQRVYRAFEE